MCSSDLSSLTQHASEGGVLLHQSKLKKKIFQNLELIPEPEPENSQKGSSDSLSSEISKLQELFNSGALSEEEFVKAKAKLLS